ncbi:TetR/AcrR family transcriptional regulator [Microbacterium sp. C23T]
MDEEIPIGRRERNKQEKLARIFQAGAELFEARGVSTVTTQELASRADVGTGTLFEYVATKTELLVMIYNRYFAESLRDGWSAQSHEQGLRDRVLALLHPVLVCHRRHAENGRAYLHEIVYGPAAERYRGEAIELVETFQKQLEDVLVDTRAVGRPAAEASARVVFAVIFLTLSDARLVESTADGLLGEIDRLLAAHFRNWNPGDRKAG